MSSVRHHDGSGGLRHALESIHARTNRSNRQYRISLENRVGHLRVRPAGTTRNPPPKGISTCASGVQKGVSKMFSNVASGVATGVIMSAGLSPERVSRLRNSLGNSFGVSPDRNAENDSSNKNRLDADTLPVMGSSSSDEGMERSRV